MKDIEQLLDTVVPNDSTGLHTLPIREALEYWCKGKEQWEGDGLTVKDAAWDLQQIAIACGITPFSTADEVSE